MISSCQGIVISSIPYSENSLICKIYTRPYGLNSFLIKGAKTSKARKSGLLRPLQPIEITHYRSAKSSLHLVKELAAIFPLVDVSASPEKTCISLFIAEVIHKTLSENMEDERLFEFLLHSVRFLELSKDHYVNFHLQFLLQYFRNCGFFPDLNEIKTSNPPRQAIPVSSFLEQIIENPLYNNIVNGTNQERKHALHWLIAFLMSQYDHTFEIKSLPVLESVFHF